jgi:protein-tyrosine phosphatase|nr:low molecular weight protein-tyrosine-phosphatase [uncultured Oscillibacter sp.]
MTKILFVCHGNICRSPMAEFVMKDLIKKAELEAEFHTESAATSTEEIGNSVYPPARRKLTEHGISCAGKTARQLTKADYAQYDLLIGMDRANIRNMNRICGGDPDGKIQLLLDYTDHPGEVADPWYTGDFDATWRDVLSGCQGLLESVRGKRTVQPSEAPHKKDGSLGRL